MVEYDVPSANIKITLARLASSARIVRLVARRSSSLRSSLVKVSAMRLDVRGKVGGIDQAGFDTYVAKAAEMCPLSKVMQGNVEITHEAVLE